MLKCIQKLCIEVSIACYCCECFVSDSYDSTYAPTGCRCLELDIWDGGRDDFGNPIPIVYHGYDDQIFSYHHHIIDFTLTTQYLFTHSHTMTTKILFEDIIKALHVFLLLHPQSYPLILSLENHCSLPFQETMAAQLKSILGKNLYIPDEQSLLGKLPSPEK